MDISRYDDAAFTYPEVGATRGELPADYDHLHETRVLGHGRELFEHAAESIMTWQMLRDAGLRVHASSARVTAGATVVLRLLLGPIAFRIPCRVVYTIDEPDRRGFAYGTLKGHPETGEELFVVEYSPDDDRVLATVSAFARPGRWFTRAGAPVNRSVQLSMVDRYLDALPNG